MAIEILSPGMLTTVQDAGRTGFAAEGYPECGACDKQSFTLANLMAGNHGDEAALECTGMGPSLRFTSDTVIAVTRAAAELNGRLIPESAPVLVLAGDTLTVTALRGMRAYIAVHGGITVPPVRGSRSTDLKCRIGGLEGRSLQQGDLLPVADCDVVRLYPVLRDAAVGAVRITLPEPAQESVIRVIPGPQEDRFTAAGIDCFYSSAYTVTPDSNRMGIRLSGNAVEAVNGTDILSDAIVEGSVQISANGMPIVMMADHQTTGGYAKIATVIPTDIPVLAQLMPGCRIRFVRTDPDTALREYREAAETLRKIKERMTQTDDEDRSEFRPGRKLRRVYHRDGRRGAPLRHIRQRGLRLPRG